MYPQYDPGLEFECDCPVKTRKNVWNDVTGIAVRYCPMCNERRSIDYQPTEEWPDDKPMPDDIRRAKAAADVRRASRGVPNRPGVSR